MVIHPKVMQARLYNVGVDIVFKGALVCILGLVDYRICHCLRFAYKFGTRPHGNPGCRLQMEPPGDE